MLQESGKRGRSGSLRKGLFTLQQHQDRGRNLILIHRDDLIDITFHNGKGDLACAADGDAVGDGRGWIDGNGMMLFDSSSHGRQP